MKCQVEEIRQFPDVWWKVGQRGVGNLEVVERGEFEQRVRNLPLTSLQLVGNYFTVQMELVATVLFRIVYFLPRFHCSGGVVTDRILLKRMSGNKNMEVFGIAQRPHLRR